MTPFRRIELSSPFSFCAISPCQIRRCPPLTPPTPPFSFRVIIAELPASCHFAFAYFRQRCRRLRRIGSHAASGFQRSSVISPLLPPISLFRRRHYLLPLRFSLIGYAMPFRLRCYAYFRTPLPAIFAAIFAIAATPPPPADTPPRRCLIL